MRKGDVARYLDPRGRVLEVHFPPRSGHSVVICIYGDDKETTKPICRVRMTEAQFEPVYASLQRLWAKIARSPNCLETSNDVQWPWAEYRTAVLELGSGLAMILTRLTDDLVQLQIISRDECGVISHETISEVLVSKSKSPDIVKALGELAIIMHAEGVKQLINAEEAGLAQYLADHPTEHAGTVALDLQLA